MFSGIILFLQVVSAGLLIFIILLQAGKSGGIAAAFGGATVETIFGSRRGNVLTKATAILAGIFMLTSLLLVRIGPASLIKHKGKPVGERPQVAQPQEQKQQ